MERNKSTWLENIELPETRPALRTNISTEVVVVGGGLAGTLTAYLLAKAGKKVVLLEEKNIASSTTAYTTAWLNAVIDTELADLIDMYGEGGASKIWTSGMEAIDLIEKIAQEENIECEFKRVSHFQYAQNENELKNLKKEHEAAEALGFETLFHSHTFLPFRNLGSLEVKNQAKYHPIKFLIGLREKAESYGVTVYENTQAEKIEGERPAVVTTKGGKVLADYVVMTTYKPFDNPLELFGHKGFYVSYVVEVSIPSGTIAPGLYEDEKNPYHYFRIDHEKGGGGRDRMILGGEDHRKAFPIPEDKNYKALREFLTDLLPNTDYEITKEWSGPILETIDGLPYIGEYSETFRNRLVATGFSGNGMTYSAISAMIITDIILGKENKYEKVYTASRHLRPYNFGLKFRDFFSEFIGGYIKNLFKP